jgi:hypothetical protein
MHRYIAFAAALGCTPPTATAFPADVHVYESHDDSAITEGDTTLVADPDLAYAAAADYARWSTMFPDIQEVKITRQRGDEAWVTFVHSDGNRDNVHFRNQPAARMVWFEDTGGRAEVWAEIVFIPGDRRGTTRLHTRLFADVHGFASLFVTDGKVRGMRQRRVRDYLVDLRGYFGRQTGTAAGR